MLPQRNRRLRELTPHGVDDQTGAALQPGEPRVEDQIDEADERSGCHAALGVIHTLPYAGQRGIFIHRQRRVRSAVPVPIAVIRVVIVVMLCPYVLRHSREDPEKKPGRAIESTAAKETPVAALVHQAEDAHREQDDEEQRNGCEPGVGAGAPDGGPPQEHERNQSRQRLHQSLDVRRPGVTTDHGALLAPKALARHHDRELPQSRPKADLVLVFSQTAGVRFGGAAVCCLRGCWRYLFYKRATFPLRASASNDRLQQELEPDADRARQSARWGLSHARYRTVAHAGRIRRSDVDPPRLPCIAL